MPRTKHETTGTLSNGDGRADTVATLTVPAGTPCKPTGDGAYWAEGWRQWAGPDYAAGTWMDHRATHYGIRVAAETVEA